MPGGHGTRALMHDEEMLAWLRAAHETLEWTTSVCTGALLLGAAGMLDGLEATTHWRGARSARRARRHPGQPPGRRAGQGHHRGRRLVRNRHGADARGADRRRGRGAAIQLAIEYDPEPPFDSGSTEKASPEIVELAAAGLTAGSTDRRPGRDRTAGPGRAPRRRPRPERPRDEHVGRRRGRRAYANPSSARSRMLKSPPSTTGRSPAQRSALSAARRASRTGPPPCRFATQMPALRSRTAWTQRRSGQTHRRRHPVLDDRVAPDEDRVGAAAVRLDQIGPADGDRAPHRQQRVARGEHEPLVRVQPGTERRRPPRRDLLEQRHVPLPAGQRGRELVEQVVTGGRHRASVLEVPGEHAHRPRPNVHSALAAPLHHRVGAQRRRAARR